MERTRIRRRLLVVNGTKTGFAGCWGRGGRGSAAPRFRSGACLAPGDDPAASGIGDPPARGCPTRKPAGASMCVRLQHRVTVCSLMAFYLLVGAASSGAQTNKTNKNIKPNRVTTALFSEVKIDYLAHATWCYDTVPAFIYSQGRTLLQADLHGHVSPILEAPEYIGVAFCSQDGRIISFVSHPDARKSALRLSIFDTESNDKAEYLISPEVSFDPGIHSLMSIDGNVFALPSSPALISGRDLLKERKIFIIKNSDIFWTKYFVFTRKDRANTFNMVRVSNLDDVGTIEFRKDGVVRNIIECGGIYFVHYFIDALQRDIVESIEDRRLSSEGNIERFDDVKAADQNSSVCTFSNAEQVHGRGEITSASILGGKSRTLADLQRFQGLAGWIASSKDGRFLLATQFLRSPGVVKQEYRIAVLEIGRQHQPNK
jgi:hypothetical protein